MEVWIVCVGGIVERSKQMCVDLTSSRKEINVNMMRYYMHSKPLVFFPFF